jgi:hypothetical protein
MDFINAGPSPAWLGVVGILSFGGLVVAAFASGYHLAIDAPAPKATAAASAEERTVSPEEPATPAPGGAARVAEPLVDRERAVLRAEPGSGKVVDELPAGRGITITRQSGDWLLVRYTRDGKAHEGWTHRVNIVPEE